MKKNLLTLYTGNGDGRTCSVLGLVFRALGRGFKTCIVTFRAGDWEYKDLATREHFRDFLYVKDFSTAIQRDSHNMEKDSFGAAEAWQLTNNLIQSGQFRLVVLCDLTTLIESGLVDQKGVIEALVNRPANVHLAITGSDASQDLVEAADLVTEMRELKHSRQADEKL